MFEIWYSFAILVNAPSHPALHQGLRTKLRLSTAYHPESDGSIERVNQEAEDMLRAFVSSHQEDWADYLYLVEFAHNNARPEFQQRRTFCNSEPQSFSTLGKPLSKLRIGKRYILTVACVQFRFSQLYKGAPPDRPPPVLVDGAEEFHIERILDHRFLADNFNFWFAGEGIHQRRTLGSLSSSCRNVKKSMCMLAAITFQASRTKDEASPLAE